MGQVVVRVALPGVGGEDETIMSGIDVACG
jgi:hypothetical protein